MRCMHSSAANQRDGVDAGWRLLFAFECQWPGATHRERQADMYRLPLILMFALAIFGCSHTPASRPIQSADVVYDNHGGLAYGGIRITLHPTGAYEKQTYTDVV